MKMDIELTDEQFEKVKILEENNISVGEAIDILFEMKDNITKHSGLYLDSRIARAEEEKAELEAKINRIEEDLSLFEKLKGTALDVNEKQKLVEKTYIQEESYDQTLQNAKHNVKWSTKFFKF
ncbi:MAG: hypothetical protein II396_06150 [Methanobrevibacter sp.]|nr:hypothetical protein [Methanobrevibacter sp.]